MNSNDTYYPDLITRYLSGEASQEELSALSAWIQSDPAHAALFDDFRKTWQGVVADQIEQQLDLDREWEALVPKLETRNPKPETGEESKVIPIAGDRLPWQVILIRASLIAAISLVLLIPSWIAYRYFTQTKMVRITASEGVLEKILPDGSLVTLNAFSSLIYSEEYGKTNRDVELKGEGYFEVNRDSLIPFIVNCSNSRIEVLGTSFYVDAGQPGQQVEVILVEGSVTVYLEEARSTGKTIIPGEKARITQADQRIVVTPNENPNFLAWKTFHLVFLDDRLDMVIGTLNKIYQADIILASENLASCRLTATFDQQSLESVLSVIMATLDLQSETTPSGIVLYGKGCD